MSALAGLSADERELAPAAPPPKTAGAMKAMLTDERFSDPAWIYERKLDGIRCVAIRTGASVKLLSRNDLSQNERWPELVEALESERCDQFVVDGEVVAFDGSQTSFAKLAQRGQHYVPVFYYVFDVLWLDGHDVRRLPLRTRKRLLRDALQFHGNVRWTQHRNRDGEKFFVEACRKGWEGLIAKRADSPYVTTRSRDWLKFKCEHGQELVIGGFTQPRGSRVEFGALLLGYYKDEAARVRRQGRDRVRHRAAPLARRAAARTRAEGSGVRRPGGDQRTRRDLGRAEARRADRLHRVDARRPPAAPALPRPA